jgi:branched-chain amino acid transport system substrate-binding protein
MKRHFLKAAAAGAGALLVSRAAFAQKKYDAGASDKEIKIGGTSPYSGPASA